MSPSAMPIGGQHYQVAIIGGGIAGITLALAFERLGIEYVLFEAHNSLAPSEGASIGLLPNGLRILDQLGVLEAIEAQSVALQTWRHVDGDGKLISSTNALGYYPEKIGYGGLFLERQKLLQIMAGQLKGKDCIKTSTRITSLEDDEVNGQVRVTTKDGLLVTADLVIGADGVRSVVRGFIESSIAGKKVHSNECMTTDFACVFGISTPTAGIAEGDCFSVYREKATILVFTGKGGVVFWFVFEDLGRTLPLSEAPRFSAADVDPVCRSVSHLAIRDGVRFESIYANRTVASKIVLEEGMAKTWCGDRAVLVGDAAHKMVPNAAMGANQALESAALLVNELHRAQDGAPSNAPFRSDALKAALARYVQGRQARTTLIKDKAGVVCRAQLGHGGPAAAVVKELPSLTDGDWLFRGFMGLADAPVIDSIPLSGRGRFYQAATNSLLKKAKARQEGQLKASNSGLFEIEEATGN